MSVGRHIENVNSTPDQVYLCSATFTTDISSGMILFHLKGCMLPKVLVTSDLIE